MKIITLFSKSTAISVKMFIIGYIMTLHCTLNSLHSIKIGDNFNLLFMFYNYKVLLIYHI